MRLPWRLRACAERALRHLLEHAVAAQPSHHATRRSPSPLDVRVGELSLLPEPLREPLRLGLDDPLVSDRSSAPIEPLL